MAPGVATWLLRLEQLHEQLVQHLLPLPLLCCLPWESCLCGVAPNPGRAVPHRTPWPAPASGHRRYVDRSAPRSGSPAACGAPTCRSQRRGPKTVTPGGVGLPIRVVRMPTVRCDVSRDTAARSDEDRVAAGYPWVIQCR